MAMRFGAKELREVPEEKARNRLKTLKRNPIFFILENIYDTYNIGGLFRLADALAAEKLYLCGDTETPPNSRIKKASVGAYKVMPWEHKKSGKEAIVELKKLEVRSKKKDKEVGSKKKILPLTSSIQLPTSYFHPQIIAVEQHPKAIDFREARYSFPLALIFGNETAGILPATLKLADQIVEIPMWGINKSLNVIVSAAVVSYFAASQMDAVI